VKHWLLWAWFASRHISDKALAIPEVTCFASALPGVPERHCKKLAEKTQAEDMSRRPLIRRSVQKSERKCSKHAKMQRKIAEENKVRRHTHAKSQDMVEQGKM
jgi:hypothetical protein